MTELQATKTGLSSSAQTAVGRLFVLGLSGDRIHSMNLDGSDLKTIVTDCHLSDGIVVDAKTRHIYWTNMGVPNLDDGSIEIGGIDRTGEVGDEHPIAGNIEGDADPFHQVRDQNLRHRLFVDRCAIDGVAARRIAAIGPIQHAVRQIELEIDGFRQLIKHLGRSQPWEPFGFAGVLISTAPRCTATLRGSSCCRSNRARSSLG
jgi:hypothetical protein